MNRTEFIIVTSIILFASFMLGWFACWLVQRLSRPTRADMGELDRLAQQLHEAEEGRDEAIVKLEEREATLMTRLIDSETELQTALEGLRESRTEVEELRSYIERKLARR